MLVTRLKRNQVMWTSFENNITLHVNIVPYCKPSPSSKSTTKTNNAMITNCNLIQLLQVTLSKNTRSNSDSHTHLPIERKSNQIWRNQLHNLIYHNYFTETSKIFATTLQKIYHVLHFQSILKNKKEHIGYKYYRLSPNQKQTHHYYMIIKKWRYLSTSKSAAYPLIFKIVHTRNR